MHSTETTLTGPQSWRERLREAAQKHQARQAWERAHPEEAAREKAARLAEARRQLEEKQLEEKDAFLERSGVAELERDLILAGLSPTWGMVRPEGAQPFSAVSVARDFWPSSDTFLCFIGARGTGKTVAAAELCTFCRFGYEHPDLGRVWCWPAAIPDQPIFRVASQLSRISGFGDDAEKEKHALRSCRLLIIDEMGAELMHDSWLALIQEIVNARYSAKRKTVLVGNCDMKTFSTRYGGRVTRRIEESGRIVDMGKVRLSGRKEAQP